LAEAWFSSLKIRRPRRGAGGRKDAGGRASPNCSRTTKKASRGRGGGGASGGGKRNIGGKVSLGEKFAQSWQEVRERFGAQARQRVAEKAGAWLEEQRKKIPSIDWRMIPAGVKDQLLSLVRKAGAPKLIEVLRGVGAPLSREEAEVALERQKAAAEAKKETLRKIWEKGIAVLPSAGAVKEWVDGVWARASAPFKPPTREEQEAALEAQKVEVKLPQFREIPFKEALAKLEDPQTRRKVAIGGAITVGCLGAGALVGYEVIGRHGSDIHWVLSQFSGLGQAAKELTREISGRVPTVVHPPAQPTLVTEMEVTKQALKQAPHAADILRETMGPLREWVKPVTGAVKEVVSKPEVVTKPEVIKGAVEEMAKTPWDVQSLREIVRQAVVAKAETLRLATEQVRQAIQTGVEIVKDSNPWRASAEAAKQVLEAAGVQSDPERLDILTDAINKAGGLPDLVQPGTKLLLKPESTADILAQAIEKTGQVIAHGGAEGLKVPADDADLNALARVVEFLRGLK